ncbi:Competence-induced protein Ccs4 [Streptococcus sp. DD10]|uniref:hypothetical protein n=1 Tax=Streptococcus sp. DD10 TaxID=1777878 RepID=UPI0007945E84|nr:hypothetical protein [Streptococcus sp. DD10]KXT72777.1 Competence-induced protein Ccs4 [Streptococcus sp. DD10]
MYRHEKQHRESLGSFGAALHQEFKTNGVWMREVEGLPWFNLLIFSILLTGVSLFLPHFSNLATNLQSQNLYASWAMTQGQMAYASFFGTSGILFYGLLWLSGYLPFGFLWIGVQFLALIATGWISYRLAYRLVGQIRVAKFAMAMVYVLVFLLGMGGLYAPIFALPVLFYSLSRIAKYIQTREKIGFIRYGMQAALAFMISPMSALFFYSIALIALALYDIRQHQFLQGVYQFLASLLGFSLLFYPIGYVTVWTGSFGDAVGQIIFDATSFQLAHSHLLENVITYLGLAFGLGFLFLLFATLTSFSKGSFELKWMGILGVVIVLVLSIFNPDFGLYHLLPLIPFVFLLITFWMGEQLSVLVGEDSRRARNTTSPLSKYLTVSLYLPFVVGVYVMGRPLVETYILHGEESRERTEVARYIKENSQSTDTIYAWDTSATMYLVSQRLSSSLILSPTQYLTTNENEIKLLNGLQKYPAYIAVNNRLTLNEDVKNILQKSYQESEQSFDQFTLYKRK